MLHRVAQASESGARGIFGNGLRQWSDTGIRRDFMDQGIKVIVEERAASEDAAGFGQKEGMCPQVQAFNDAVTDWERTRYFERI